MKLPFSIFFCCVLSSCASILNSPTTTVVVHTTHPSKVIIGKDSSFTASNQTKMQVMRSKEPMLIIVSGNGIQKQVLVKPFNSFAYYYNILATYGIGLRFDKNNPKRYSYPRHLYFHLDDSLQTYYRNLPVKKKGAIDLHFSFPHANSFFLHPDGEATQANTGFWGLSFGVDYYYKANRFVSMSATGAADIFSPVPAPTHRYGEYAVMSTTYLSITNNHRLKRFLLGYGIQASNNTWDLRYRPSHNSPPPSRPPVKKTATALGLVFPFRYQTGNRFFVGTVYRPNLLRLTGGPAFRYEHLVSLEFGWKMKVKE